MNKYKSYGKGWHFDSYKHSLAAKGIKTSFGFISAAKARREAIAKRTLGQPGIKRTKGGKIAGISSIPLTSKEKKQLDAMKLAATFQPREERRNYIRKIIMDNPPENGMTYKEYLDNYFAFIKGFVPLDTAVTEVAAYKENGQWVAKGEKSTVKDAIKKSAQEVYFDEDELKDNKGFYSINDWKFNSDANKFEPELIKSTEVLKEI